MLTEMTRTLDPEEIKRKLEGESSPEEAVEAAKDPKLQRSYSFEFHHETPNGRRYAGSFTNRILTFQDRSRVGAMRASLQMGLPASSIDEDTLDLNAMIAHMTISLSERPKWAKNLSNLDDRELLEKLWGEVTDHEATFHGPLEKTAAGAGESAGD